MSNGRNVAFGMSGVSVGQTWTTCVQPSASFWAFCQRNNTLCSHDADKTRSAAHVTCVTQPAVLKPHIAPHLPRLFTPSRLTWSIPIPSSSDKRFVLVGIGQWGWGDYSYNSKQKAARISPYELTAQEINCKSVYPLHRRVREVAAWARRFQRSARHVECQQSMTC